MNETVRTIPVADGFDLHLDDIHFDAIRAQGAGGQNVNKVSSALHLRFDLRQARLPDRVREKLLSSGDSRISTEGVLILKAQNFRTQARNRRDAIERLLVILREAAAVRRRRIATRPSRAARERRLKDKDKRSKNKVLRKKPNID